MTVIIGIDPHKTTHMVVAIDDDEHAIARLEVNADPAQRSGCWRGRRAGRFGPEATPPAARRVAARSYPHEQRPSRRAPKPVSEPQLPFTPRPDPLSSGSAAGQLTPSTKLAADPPFLFRATPQHGNQRDSLIARKPTRRRQGILETTRQHPRRYEHTAARASDPLSGQSVASGY